MWDLNGCFVRGCKLEHEAKGFCRKHYKKHRRGLGLISPTLKEYRVQYYRSDAGRYSSLKRAAKDKGLGFDITKQEHALMTKMPCHYCGGPITPTGHGLDRMDSSKGYLKENVITCCVSCNRIKSDVMTHDEAKFVIGQLIRYRLTVR